MNAIKKILIIVIVGLLFSTITANAALQWVMGETFDHNGKTITKEEQRNGNFYNGVRLHTKSSSGTMIMQLKGEKKGLLFYGKVGEKNFSVSREGQLENEEIYSNYNASGNNKVRLTWKQISDGILTATLLY